VSGLNETETEYIRYKLLSTV